MISFPTTLLPLCDGNDVGCDTSSTFALKRMRQMQLALLNALSTKQERIIDLVRNPMRLLYTCVKMDAVNMTSPKRCPKARETSSRKS